MAQMFPDMNKARVVFASRAEEIFYKACRESLGKAWKVYYSVTLSSVEQGQGMKDNEMDFVLYHPRYGVIVVEVKGGRIRYEQTSNNFFSVNRYGESFTIKNPFQQALVWKSRFIRAMRQTSMKAPVTHAVCFPDVTEGDFPESSAIEPAIIIGKQRLHNLEQSLKDMVFKVQPEKYLRFDDVAEPLTKMLAGSDFCTKLYIRDYIDTHELRVKDTESIQDSFITPIVSSQRLGIEGEAGTGKTILALRLAQHFRDQGQSVLLLSSNSLLNLFLKEQAGEAIQVKTYNEVADSYGISLLSAPPSYNGTLEDWVQFEAPDLLSRAIDQGSERYDVILCDEAQDVQPFWWDVIEKLLVSREKSRLYIFFDRSQGVFGSGGNNKHFVAEDVLPVEQPYFPLVNNYRTTREIAEFSRSFRTGKQILHSHSGRLGYLPEIVTYTDKQDCQKKLARLLRKLTREEALETSDITLLTARKANADASVIKGMHELANVPLHHMGKQDLKDWKNARAPRGKLPVATFAGFKGLETNVGILLNISEYNLPLTHPIMASLTYVACTRAKHMLYIFVQQNDMKRTLLERALKSIDHQGALVLDGDYSDHEFSGTVAHYNSERVGWLTVESSDFQASSVMFFPHDVEAAGLGPIKVGDRIKFRPRNEGRAVIACDLRRIVEQSAALNAR